MILISVLSLKYVMKFLPSSTVLRCLSPITACHFWNQKVIHFLPVIYILRQYLKYMNYNSLVVCKEDSKPHFIQNLQLYVFQSFFVPLNKTFLLKCLLKKKTALVRYK